MDKHNHYWNTALLQEMFSPNEVQAILAMPINSVERPDKLVWFHSNDVHFTVRSAYHLQHAMSLNSQGNTSTSMNVTPLWQSIWKLKVPNQTKRFIWKACKKILPNLHNLMKRKIMNSDIFPLCL